MHYYDHNPCHHYDENDHDKITKRHDDENDREKIQKRLYDENDHEKITKKDENDPGCSPPPVLPPLPAPAEDGYLGDCRSFFIVGFFLYFWCICHLMPL